MRRWEFIYISSSPLVGDFWNIYLIFRSFLLLASPTPHPFSLPQYPPLLQIRSFAIFTKRKAAKKHMQKFCCKGKLKKQANKNHKQTGGRKDRVRKKNISQENPCRTRQHLVFGLSILSPTEPHLCGLLREDVNSSSPNNAFVLKSALAKHDIHIFCLTQERIPFALGTIQCYLLPSNLKVLYSMKIKPNTTLTHKE